MADLKLITRLLKSKTTSIDNLKDINDSNDFKKEAGLFTVLTKVKF